MSADDIYKRIKDLLAERNWSLYKLADVCDLPRSSLYNMMERNNMPSLPTLETICSGMGISLSDFFIFTSPAKNGSFISEDEVKLLELHRTLPKEHQEILYAYALGLSDSVKLSSQTKTGKSHRKSNNKK